MGTPMKILVGYDGSSSAQAALDDLKNAGLPSRAHVLVLTAADVYLPQGKEIKMPAFMMLSVEKARNKAKAQLAQAAVLAKEAHNRLKRIFPGWTIKTEACADSPAWALVKKADTWKPDLLVVGAHGHSNIGRFLGSVSQMIVTQSDCPARVGRSTMAGRHTRVLIGVDGSADSMAAVKAVADRNWPAGTEFKLVAVIDPHRTTFMEKFAPGALKWFFEQADDEHRVVGRLLESQARQLRSKDRLVTCEVKDGDPKRVLVEEANAWNANVIFVGARGLGHSRRFLVGGVSMAVAARAECAVEIIRPK